MVPAVERSAALSVSSRRSSGVPRGWQDRRKAWEIKVALVERVSLAVTKLFTATRFAQVGAVSQSQADLDAAYRVWLQDKAQLDAVLAAYFPGRTVHHRWTTSRALTSAYYVQSGVHDAAARRVYVANVLAGVARNPPQDLSEVPVEGDPSPDVGSTAVESLRNRIRESLNATVEAIVEEPLRL